MRQVGVCVCALALTACILSAQGTPNPPAPPGHDVTVGLAALKAALVLTDGQLTQLQQMERDRTRANRAVESQIAERRRTLETALAATPPDAATVGNVMLDIRNLQKIIQANDEKYRGMAVSLLTTDQKNKLQDLENAEQLRPAVAEAIAVDLLAAPTPAVGSAAPRAN